MRWFPSWTGQGSRPACRRRAGWKQRSSGGPTTRRISSRRATGWCHLTAIIDCCDRTIVGWRLSRSGIARVAASALGDALRDRRIDATHGLVLRSDNGLVFGAKTFVRVARRYGITQEYITPYSPEQNGMIERFFKTVKEECVWLQRLRSRSRIRGDRAVARTLPRQASAFGARLSHTKRAAGAISGLSCTETEGTPHHGKRCGADNHVECRN